MTGRMNRQCGRSSLCSDSDDVCHCEGKCAQTGTRDVDVHADLRTGFVVALAQLVTKTCRLKKRTCGDV